MHLSDYPHRRFNPLSGEWVLCSPHRTKRPWQGQVEKPALEELPPYDPGCYLCPGNKRAGGFENPEYPETFVFVNDFSALLREIPDESLDLSGLLVAENAKGLCKVVCYSPRHDLTLPRMPVGAVRRLVDVWVDEYREIGAMKEINHVQIFENRGEVMGCSNPHPHGQIWASSIVPDLPAKETERQKAYLKEKSSCLLCDYLKLESDMAEDDSPDALGFRAVCANESFAALVPFWATWPFEVLLLPKRHMTGIDEMTPPERDALADILKNMGTRYDNLFSCSFPYSMGIHQRPTDGEAHPEWHFHLHYYPPLLRSATVKKFMVGFELLGMPQRDISPESAAKRLREQSEKHYGDGK